MELAAAEALARDLMCQHLPHTVVNPWGFRWDKARRRYGLCSYRHRFISLSAPLTKLSPEEQVRDTILHEIAHVLAGPVARHGRLWKVTAASIGARPEPCVDARALGIELPKGKWTVKCACRTFTRIQGPKLGKRYSCAHCHNYVVWSHEDGRVVDNTTPITTILLGQISA